MVSLFFDILIMRYLGVALYGLIYLEFFMLPGPGCLGKDLTFPRLGKFSAKMASTMLSTPLLSSPSGTSIMQMLVCLMLSFVVVIQLLSCV